VVEGGPEQPLGRPDGVGAVHHDLTCDSDGQIQVYVGGEGIESTVALHRPRAGEPYLLGVFLVGAYQEILADEHNLLGHTHSVDVVLQGEAGYQLSTALRGEQVEGVLRGLHYDTEHLLDSLPA
jgi:arginine decarboxylase